MSTVIEPRSLIPQVEDALLAHPQVAHCAVVGVPHEALGEAVTAIISCDRKEVGSSSEQPSADQQPVLRSCI